MGKVVFFQKKPSESDSAGKITLGSTYPFANQSIATDRPLFRQVPPFRIQKFGT